MKIDIQFVSINKMRYASIGDYFMRRGIMFYRIARLSKAAYMVACLCHELVEYFMCLRDGIAEKDITAFDIRHAREQACGLRPQHEECGDAWDCLYRKQHQAATSVERAVIAAFGEIWDEYEDECVKMFKTKGVRK